MEPTLSWTIQYTWYTNADPSVDKEVKKLIWNIRNSWWSEYYWDPKKAASDKCSMEGGTTSSLPRGHMVLSTDVTVTKGRLLSWELGKAATQAMQVPATHTNRKQAGIQCKSAWQACFPPEISLGFIRNSLTLTLSCRACWASRQDILPVCCLEMGAAFTVVEWQQEGHLVGCLNFTIGAAGARKARKESIQEKANFVMVERSAVQLCDSLCVELFCLHTW